MGPPPPGTGLRLLSPLAEGADRLVAQEALLQNYELAAILPFPQDEYEQDFDDESIAEFRMLLKQTGEDPSTARLLILDGSQGDNRDRAYEADAPRFDPT